MDVETNKIVPERFHILEIPSLLMICNGQVIQKIEGIISRKDLEKKIIALIELSSQR
jgi:thioredoxin-like negative regulator of GroEL